METALASRRNGSGLKKDFNSAAQAHGAGTVTSARVVIQNDFRNEIIKGMGSSRFGFMGLLTILALLLVYWGYHYYYTQNLDVNGYLRKKNALPDWNSDGLSKLCSFRHEVDLSGFIWSHRAHWSNSAAIASSVPSISIDGSAQALRNLLEAGIVNFDVDVSFFDDSFYVAHPEVLKHLKTSPKGALLTVQGFLSIASQHINIQRRHAAGISARISLEPKFSDPMLLARFADLLLYSIANMNPQAAIRLALIVNSQQMLETVTTRSQNFRVESQQQHEIAVQAATVTASQLHEPRAKLEYAMAFRSQPKSDQDFNWTRDVISQMCRWESPRAHLSTGSKRRIGGTLKKTPNSTTCCNLLPKHSELESAAMVQKLLMPDVKLLDTGVSFCDRDIGARGGNAYPAVVSWLVDSEFALMEALRAGVDGVVSNDPIFLLRRLEELHRAKCQ